ncbi:MAG: hypothetical protein QXL96_08895 [Ignisphaera sp.]
MEELAQYIKDFITSRAPEFLSTLNKLCYKQYNKDCITLFISDPEKLRKILMMYNDESITRFVIKNLFLKPLLKKLDKEELLEELANDFIINIEKFKEKLLKN